MRPIPNHSKTTPCHKCPKVPDDVRRAKGYACTSADALEPTDRHWHALQQFAECDAIRQFPDDDGWIREDASIIRPIKELAERQPITQAMRLMALGIKKGK